MEAENKKLLSFNEAADFLGYKKSYLYRLTSNGKIPFSKPNNGRIFFDKEKLEAWVLRPAEKNAKAKREDTQQMLLDIALKAVRLNSLAISEPSKHLSNG